MKQTHSQAQSSSIYLCAVSEIHKRGEQEFALDNNQRLFVIASDNRLYGYINNCPHANWPLNFQPDIFLNREKTHIQCSNHMALFDKKTGECVRGPCVGDSLKKVDLTIIDDLLYFTPSPSMKAGK